MANLDDLFTAAEGSKSVSHIMEYKPPKYRNYWYMVFLVSNDADGYTEYYIFKVARNRVSDGISHAFATMRDKINKEIYQHIVNDYSKYHFNIVNMFIANTDDGKIPDTVTQYSRELDWTAYSLDKNFLMKDAFGYTYKIADEAASVAVNIVKKKLDENNEILMSNPYDTIKPTRELCEKYFVYQVVTESSTIKIGKKVPGVLSDIEAFVTLFRNGTTATLRVDLPGFKIIEATNLTVGDVQSYERKFRREYNNMVEYYEYCLISESNKNKE